MALLKEQQLNPMPHRKQLTFCRRIFQMFGEQSINLFKIKTVSSILLFLSFFVPCLLIFIFVQNILLVCFHKKREISKLWECVHRFVYVFTAAAVTNASCGMLPLVSLEPGVGQIRTGIQLLRLLPGIFCISGSRQIQT